MEVMPMGKRACRKWLWCLCVGLAMEYVCHISGMHLPDFPLAVVTQQWVGFL